MKSLKNNQGVVLFLVLWVLILLSVIAGEFSYAMRTDLVMTRNHKEKIQSYYIANAGVSQAIWTLCKPENKTKSENNDGDNDEGGVVFGINRELPPVQFENGNYRLRIDNESGKININTAKSSTLVLMFNQFNLSRERRQEIIDSIMDWRDEDHLHRSNGAEDRYYRSLKNPYDCKDGDFDTIDELLLVKGMTPALYYGGIKDIVTVYYDSDGDDEAEEKEYYTRININAAPAELINALPAMTDELTSEVCEFRANNTIGNISQIREIVGEYAYNAVRTYLTVDLSPFYTITSEGNVTGTKAGQTIKAVVKIENSSEKVYSLIQRYEFKEWGALSL